MKQNVKFLKELEKQIKFLKNKDYWNYYKDHKDRILGEIEVCQAGFKGKNVLEIGAYPYFMTYCLKKAGFNVIGVDINPSRFEGFLAKNDLIVLKIDIERQKLPFDDNSVDNVLFSEVFEHLGQNPLFAIQEINRILKPGGKFILTTPNLYRIGNILRYIRGKGITKDVYSELEKIQKYGHLGHLREYSKYEILTILKKTGFQIKSARYLHHPHNGKRTIFAKLLSLFYKVFGVFREGLMVEGEKGTN
ncbi:MAG: methyltransferase domain-containing protein [Candidatus Moranbacteria bacterium]|nr:methyltransferase domain-containing protein [Candidatus Moranbacteria bacterium]